VSTRAGGLLRTPAGRLRAPWRLAAYVGVLVVSSLVALGLVGPAVDVAGRASGIAIEPFWWAMVVALVGTHAVMIRWVDDAPWDAVWLGREAARPPRWLFGTIVGVIAIAIPTTLLLGAGWLRAEDAPDGSWAMAAARAALLLLPAALAEELFFRGYPFRILGDAWGWVPAVIVTSVVFGLVHAQNPGAGVQNVSVVVLAGAFLAVIVLVTRSLYAAWMAHFGWNWTMSAVFHSAVSGAGVETPDYRVVDAGPDWATGGAWGPEGGAAAALGMLCVGGLLLARRRAADRRLQSPELRTAAGRREEPYA
jgi:membrane protease YdiL (CAAX protease family)